MADLILQLTEQEFHRTPQTREKPMLHVVYTGDVHPDEAVSVPDVMPILGFRVKTPSGRYYHVLADSRETAEAWAAAQTNGKESAAPTTLAESVGGFLGLGRKKAPKKDAEENPQ
jgi:hypothetical protein